MKKLVFFLTIAIVVGVAACKSNPKTQNKEQTKSDCLIGTWGYVENGFEMTFTFNEDKTGQEISSPTDTHHFTWTYKEGNPTIIYDGETTEWSFGLDCSAKELKVMGIDYTKK
ncbi:MAG TPA: hypothetical protein PKH02_01415 [Bacteroidales bacterium]|nr:hypothetical protein [Bacteroidales bacterium]